LIVLKDGSHTGGRVAPDAGQFGSGIGRTLGR